MALIVYTIVSLIRYTYFIKDVEKNSYNYSFIVSWIVINLNNFPYHCDYCVYLQQRVTQT